MTTHDMTMADNVKAVHFLLPWDWRYACYQRYYHQGLRETLGKHKLFVKPVAAIFLRILLSKQFHRLEQYVLSRVLGSRQRVPQPFCHDHSTYVGQYVAEMRNGTQLRFAVDAHDHQDIRSTEILDWSDLYFKSNYWPMLRYPEKVYPIVNGNGTIGSRSLKRLRALRSTPKDLDVVFISRVWDSREHDIRLFENLARLPGSKKLLAIFPKPGEPKHVALQDRLARASVPWTYRYVPQRDLWRTMARARVVILRSGHHMCMPWRAIDLLAMGACILLDRNPRPEWPVPLREHVNYVSMELPVDQPDANANDYVRIPALVNQLLENHVLQTAIRKNNRDYFEDNASPTSVGEYIVGALGAY